MKKYNQAPLPFMGQKRRFVSKFRELLKHYPDNLTIVDLFGGSGLLSRVAKDEKPLATVVYNDFDNYRKRLGCISQTNALITEIREFTKDCPPDKKLPDEIREAIVKRLEQEEASAGYVDYITLSSSLLFSGNFAKNREELKKHTFYNRTKKPNYNSEGYLDGLKVVSMDYRELFECYKDDPNVLFLLDPPYLDTDAGHYNMECWRLSDYLDILKLLVGRNYIYFTSDKSGIIELCEWVGQFCKERKPFGNMQKKYLKTTMNYNASYNDIMLFTPPPILIFINNKSL